jgi:hypothetical protein
VTFLSVNTQYFSTIFLWYFFEITSFFGVIFNTLHFFVIVVISEFSSNLANVFSFLTNYFSSVNGFSGYVYNFGLILTNPQVDIDLTANTDCEDLLVFFGDILEFVEQDKVFLADVLFDS